MNQPRSTAHPYLKNFKPSHSLSSLFSCKQPLGLGQTYNPAACKPTYSHPCYKEKVSSSLFKTFNSNMQAYENKVPSFQSKSPPTTLSDDTIDSDDKNKDRKSSFFH